MKVEVTKLYFAQVLPNPQKPSVLTLASKTLCRSITEPVSILECSRTAAKSKPSGAPRSFLALCMEPT